MNAEPKLPARKRRAVAPKDDALPVTGPPQAAILDTRLVPVGDLTTYEKNPNMGDVDRIAKSLRKNGQYRSIVVWMHDMAAGQDFTKPWQVLAGNHTFMAAKAIGMTHIKCDLVSATEERARSVVLVDNEAAKHAETDDGVVLELLRSITDYEAAGFDPTDDLIAQLTNEAATSTNPLPAINATDELDDTPNYLPGLAELKQSPIFTSKAYMGLPELDPGKIPSVDMFELVTWAGPDLVDHPTSDHDGRMWFHSYGNISARGLDWHRCILSFFTDDDRFEHVWHDKRGFATKMLNRGLTAAIEPDYSTWFGEPLALNGYQTFRNRYMGRYFQEAGIGVIPNMNGSDRSEVPWIVAGVPDNPATLCSQMQTFSDGDVDFRAAILAECLNIVGQPGTFLCYGNSRVAMAIIKRAGLTCPVVYLEPVMLRRRNFKVLAGDTGTN